MTSGRHHLLIISAQMPYPVRSGFQARVWNLAQAAAAEHEVTVLAYAPPSARPPRRPCREDSGSRRCRSSPPRGAAKRVGQLRCIVTGRPWTTSSVATPQLAEAARRIARDGHVTVVMLESSALASLPVPDSLPVILDEHNIEYEVAQRLARR